MKTPRTPGIGSRLVRLVFVTVFASLLAIGGGLAPPVAAEFGPPIYQPMGCGGACP
jgi:hypothetical protein